MKITIPDFSLVVLIGASGSGKSTFARTHFKPTEILNSDFFRGLISDDEGDQTITKDAFDALYYIASRRLAHRKLTVIDATNVQFESRKPLVALARKFHALLVAIVLDMPEELCWRRTQERPDRNFGKHVVVNHVRDLRRSLKRLQREGFKQVHHLRSVEEMASVVIERQRLWTDRRDEHGPFDIIGDVHGCADEL
ncbi:MAG: polynucleotide kinase-phosphatase, partial [Deltaproteobacteria bacterium]